MTDFNGKKITLMGLGLLGRGLGDARFFATHGAELIITDLKTEAELAPSIVALQDALASQPKTNDPDASNLFDRIIFHLGAHRLEDFEDRDLIIRAPNAPLDSPFLAHAREHGIPIEMDSALFVKLCHEKFRSKNLADALVNGVTIVGITGTRGKSTTTHLIYEMTSAAFSDTNRRVFLGGNVRDMATLPLIDEVGVGDIVILELDSWQLQGFETDRMSPHLAVWTNFMPDHMNYYHGDMERYFADKAAIARFQHTEDIFIAPREIAEKVNKNFFGGAPFAATCIDPFTENILSRDWDIALPGKHNRANAACAACAARALGISDTITQKVLKTFHALPNRLELLGEKNGIAFYNDSNATTPDATLVALRTLELQEKIKNGGGLILIVGGNDKELDYEPLAKELEALRMKKILKKIVMFDGKASEKIKALLPENLRGPSILVSGIRSMPNAVRAALAAAEPGDTILLSPAATSFGLFQNEYDRGEQFRKAFETLSGLVDAIRTSQGDGNHDFNIPSY